MISSPFKGRIISCSMHNLHRIAAIRDYFVDFVVVVAVGKAFSSYLLFELLLLKSNDYGSQLQ